ncbi:uncharacterized protein LOC131071237 [Cryptomeria japonica]|uniref:uncharacterized protein LOC131071237 n=1 Tax=Cryptomeria japonica TaxID=3369 RepID=UPI0027DA08DD|nr:uncharacterized protein LOC131071237 [Cryptomeria japonica]
MDIFNVVLKQQFLEIDNISVDERFNKENYHVHSSLLILIIHKALSTCKRTCSRKKVVNTFQTNPWYDEECKATKRSLKGKDLNKENKKRYTKLIQAKIEEYVKARRKELISLRKYNPKDFGRNCSKGENKLKTVLQMPSGLNMQSFFMSSYRSKIFLPVSTSVELFTLDDIKQGIKSLANGKASDIDGLQAKFFKWGPELLAPHIKGIFNIVIRDSFLVDWTTSVVIPLFESGDINKPSNYHTIMVNPLLGKCFRSMVESRISGRAKVEGKRAKGQASFRPRHSTIDHCIMLRHLIEKIWDNQWEEAYCCFVDFKKAFDMVPKDKLWNRMEDLGIPNMYRAAVRRLYEKVRAKIKTSEGMSVSW